jgi:multiphosphoryl transfer protein
MTERILRGIAASGGAAVGRALVLCDPEPQTGKGGEAEQARALGALALVAAELDRCAANARAAGRSEESEILEANRLMAEDPALAEEVRALAADLSAAAAVREATERHAALLAGLDDPLLAARAADVRRLGTRAARILSDGPGFATPLRPAVLVARDLGPADIAELELRGGRIRGIALAGGNATSHVVIMARSLGLPMAVGLGEDVLEARNGEEIALDGGNGVVVLSPGASVRDQTAAAMRRQERERRELAAARTLPPVTTGGRLIRLLCNASTQDEVRAGLAAGAEGVGLVRTELAFLDAPCWPGEEELEAALAPVLARLAGRTATVRTFDFGADKTPPFLAGTEARGLALMLAHPDALAAQLRAIAAAGARTRLRVLLPLVERAEQLRAVRALAPEPLPYALGAMIETPEGARRAAEIAAEADFLSIGTNDLVQYTLGLDRGQPLASVAAAGDPAVLRLIEVVVEAAHAAGRTVEICGEAAGEPDLVPLLVELGVDELSVAPARLDAVRAAVRRSGERAHDRGQAFGGLDGVLA